MQEQYKMTAVDGGKMELTELDFPDSPLGSP